MISFLPAGDYNNPTVTKTSHYFTADKGLVTFFNVATPDRKQPFSQC